VILVGELRNEMMKLALQLASFGILVFATVHTNSAGDDRTYHQLFPADEQPQIRGLPAESPVGIVPSSLEDS
jgi:twitching motility protein PilT